MLLGLSGWGGWQLMHSSQVAMRQTVLRTDSLNSLAYVYRYCHADTSLYYARKAYRSACPDYNQGKIEALSHQMCVAYLQMDFKETYRLYQRIQESTNNQIELFISEIYMMKVCQRTSQNRLFFDYYNRALQRMHRIREEHEGLSEKYMRRLTQAEIEFRLTAAANYLYLWQAEQALQEINQIDEEGPIAKDQSLLSYYCFIKGAGRLFDGNSAEEKLLNGFDYLMAAYTLSLKNGYRYVEAITLQTMANYLSREDIYDKIFKYRQPMFNYLYDKFVTQRANEGLQSDSTIFVLPMAMAMEALSHARKYNNLIIVSNSYQVIGNIHFMRKEYYQSLNAMEMALSYLNLHHRKYYPDDKGPMLQTYYSEDSLAVDIRWLKQMQTVPAWLAVLREHLSVIYGALNDKQKSDYNRNVYLDLLELARQDKSLESRYGHLEEKNKALNTLLIFIFVLMGTSVVGLILYARLWKKRNEIQMGLLQSMLDCFNKMTFNVPQRKYLDEVMRTYPWLARERRIFQEVLMPYIEWMDKNRSLTNELDEERLLVQEELARSEQQIAVNKRRNISKRAKVSLVHEITPFVDRILNEVHRIRKDNSHERRRLEYIEELTDRINVYNDVLTQWIQLHRGDLNFSIESFPLQALFHILKKSKYAYTQKNVRLEVHDTDCWVKADKALTLFMINTLADNARKFTPSGGRVTVTARDIEQGVEVVITDTGCGLSEEEVCLILDSKIYDAGKIGKGAKGKGHGFGLMNCKGIIERYKKMNDIFSVCRFDISSEKGKGSCFSFRLPRGISKMLLVGWLSVCGGTVYGKQGAPDPRWMARATLYADSIYFSNINGTVEQSMQYADSAFKYINLYYSPVLPSRCRNMKLSRLGKATDGTYLQGEVGWLNAGVKADYYLIMSVRNETAVAALALHQWEVYEYNNQQYTRLYKLLSIDTSLEEFYKSKMETRNNINVSIVLLVGLAVCLLVLVYIIYFRRRILFRFNIVQVQEVNRAMLKKLEKLDRPEQLDELVPELLTTILSGLNEMYEVNGIALVLYKENGERIGYYAQGRFEYGELTYNLLERAYQTRESLSDAVIHTKVYPLQVVLSAEKDWCLGGLAVNSATLHIRQTDLLLEQYIVNYLAILLYEIVIKRGRKWDHLALAEDEKMRSKYEESRLRVQNQILDNCLSTIKHESMYYPSRIKQVVRSICEDYRKGEEHQTHTLCELAEYYKEIYTLLSAQAERQLASVYFKCTPVEVAKTVEKWRKRTLNRIKKKNQVWAVEVNGHCAQATKVNADEVLLDYLLENMTDAFLGRITSGDPENTLRMDIACEDDFVRFTLFSSCTLYSQEQVEDLFYPDDISHYPYLLCKEIIREHDQLNNFCGCRINAEIVSNGGCCVWFTLPKIGG